MGDYRETKHIYTIAPNMRKDNPVDIQECHEYITTLQNDLRDGWGEQAGKKLLEDIKECLIWVEQNG